MRRMKRTLLASALFVGLGLSYGEAAAQFSGFFFFGDSLSDAGSFKPVLPPGTGKFTTNPGPIWAEVLAQRYGFTATPANQRPHRFRCMSDAPPLAGFSRPLPVAWWCGDGCPHPG